MQDTTYTVRQLGMTAWSGPRLRLAAALYDLHAARQQGVDARLISDQSGEVVDAEGLTVRCECGQITGVECEHDDCTGATLVEHDHEGRVLLLDPDCDTALDAARRSGQGAAAQGRPGGRHGPGRGL